ncbi:hypothetical protein D0B32_15010 [Paraburkholderia sp. DHOC27]|nr:hypothetical protein D0B32_15010 [Paraburkholderia sp. DHOC27]
MFRLSSERISNRCARITTKFRQVDLEWEGLVFGGRNEPRYSAGVIERLEQVVSVVGQKGAGESEFVITIMGVLLACWATLKRCLRTKTRTSAVRVEREAYGTCLDPS